MGSSKDINAEKSTQDGNPLSMLMQQMDDEGEWLVQLRSRVLKMSQSEDVDLAEAGQYWAAGLGALVESELAGDSDEGAVHQQNFIEYFAKGTEAWLKMSGKAARKAKRKVTDSSDKGILTAQAFEEIATYCKAAGNGLGGDKRAMEKANKVGASLEKTMNLLQGMDDT